MDLSPRSTRILTDVKKALEYGVGTSATRQEIQSVIDEHISKAHANSGYLANEAEISAAFMKTETGKQLYEVLVKADTRDEQPSEAPPQPVDKAYERLEKAARFRKADETTDGKQCITCSRSKNGALRNGICKKCESKLSTAAVKALDVAATIQEDPTLYDEYLKSQEQASAPEPVQSTEKSISTRIDDASVLREAQLGEPGALLRLHKILTDDE